MGSLPSRVPLVIGVTGHRDLRTQDVPLLEREVAAIITRLQCDYIGEDNETPLVLISALAEGADRIVARVALALGVRLIAPLPLPITEYRRDFEPGLTPGAAIEFDQLLSQADSAPIMSFTAGNSLEAVRTDATKRAEQYRAVGLFIVRHSDVLIALWDGNENDKAAGGTGEVVTFKRDGIPLVVSGSAHASLDGSEIGPVIHVVTPRNKPRSPATDVTVLAWGSEVIRRHRGGSVPRFFDRVGEIAANLLGHKQKSVVSNLSLDDRRDLDAWETFESLVALTQEFNGEAAALEAMTDGSFQTANNIDMLFTDPDDGRLDGDAKKHALKAASHWCKLYGISDTLAKKRQVQFKNDWKLLFVFSFLAFIFFALFSHIGWASNWLLGGYTVAVAIIFYVFIRAQIRRDQERFLDYRALAEALRVAVYWNILGMDRHWSSVAKQSVVTNVDTIGMLARSYPIKQPSELAWIKICLRTLELWYGAEGNRTKLGMDPKTYAIARRFWVHGQLSYFERQGIQHSRRAEILEGWALIVLFITPFFLVPLLVSAIGEGRYLGLRLHDLFLIAIGILPGLAATLTSYSERLALKAQARQYDRMRMLFKRAYDLLPEMIDSSSEYHILSLYRELGTEAMKENADWVAIYRQRPIRPVQ
jgi:hypothetical protein